jgi:hypothetical protein
MAAQAATAISVENPLPGFDSVSVRIENNCWKRPVRGEHVKTHKHMHAAIRILE